MLNKNVFTTQDVLKEVEISRLTLYRWLKSGKVPEVSKDYKQHRLFTRQDILKIKKFKNSVHAPPKMHKKKPSQKKWSSTFLNLSGSWEDDRSVNEIIHDIYSSRHDTSDRNLDFL